MVRSFRWASRLLVSASALAACAADPPMRTGDTSSDGTAGPTDTDETTQPDDHGSTSSGEPADACADACGDATRDAGAARCHACRCKVAFDDWLPAPDELQCADGIPIVTYHGEVTEGELTLEPAPINAVACTNPSLLTGSCRPGSRLGRLQHDDVTVQWICRDPYLDVDGTAMFHDVAIIGHNARTGATCFWDDVDDVTHEDDLPPLDLDVASDDALARHLAVFDLVDPDVCTRCHDHDPFIYTPYLESTGWISIAQAKGPYSAVTLDPTPAPIDATHLVSDRAAPCLSCHRLGSNATCGRFVGDAMGLTKDSSYEGVVRDATLPGSPHWQLAHWMPSASVPIADYQAWLATFADAREHIVACCASPGDDVGECRWEAVPSQ